MTPLDTYRMVADQLTEEERVALADALYVNPLAALEDGPA